MLDTDTSVPVPVVIILLCPGDAERFVEDVEKKSGERERRAGRQEDQKGN